MAGVAIIAGALAVAAGHAPAANGAPVLRDFTWHPLLGAPRRSALGVRGPRTGRTVALLQIGLPGATPRQLTVFRVDCAADRVDAIDAFAVDPALTRATAAVPALGVQPQADALAAGRSLSLADLAEAPAGALVRMACDDAGITTLRTAPLSALNDDATYIDDEQDRK